MARPDHRLDCILLQVQLCWPRRIRGRQRRACSKSSPHRGFIPPFLADPGCHPPASRRPYWPRLVHIIAAKLGRKLKQRPVPS